MEKFVPLIRSLAQTVPGQEAKNEHHQLKRIKAKKDEPVSAVSFLLSSVTSVDIKQELQRERLTRTKPAKPWEPSAFVQADAIPDAILCNATPSIMQNADVSQVLKKSSKSTPDGTPKPRGRLRKDLTLATAAAKAQNSAGESSTKKRGRPPTSTSDTPTTKLAKKARTSAVSSGLEKEAGTATPTAMSRDRGFVLPSSLSPDLSQSSPREGSEPALMFATHPDEERFDGN